MFAPLSPKSKVQSLISESGPIFDLPSWIHAKANTKIEEIVNVLSKAKVSILNRAMDLSKDSNNSSLVVANAISPLLVMPPVQPPPNYKAVFDFDGDNESDAGRWRMANGEWAIKKSSDNQTQTHTLGSSSDVVVSANYDGDSKTDYAVFNSSTGSWTIYQSSSSTNVNHTLGQSGDIPVAADYDGDGKADVAVWRPSNGAWYYKSSINGSVISTAFGTSGDITAQADYDGDSKTDFAVFRPSNGYWYILRSSDSITQYLQWGMNGDVPATGDYDGDGKADVTIWRPSSGTWWSLKSSDNNNSWTVRTWGNYGDQVVPADYDGDGKTDFAVWRPTSGVWYIIKSSDDTYDYKQIGINTDVAIPSAFLKKTGFQVSPYEMAKVRLSPKNATGGTNLYSQNIGWSSSLAGLSGRGLSAGLGLSYNSLVWTKQNSGSNNSLYFDIDQSNVTPGFRLGYSVIEPRYTNSDTGKDSFILITSSGSRVELRQKAATNYFESVDSSYIQLKVKESQNPNDVESQEMTLYMTDGSTMNYIWKGGAYRITQIKDRNGNFITINHDDLGLLRTITDTLGRVITVNYNSELLPTSITQQRGSTNYTWATFTYTNITINTNFSPIANLTVFGPSNGTSLKVLSQITLADGSSQRFDYNSYGQVTRFNSHSANSNKLNHIYYNLPFDSTGGQSDCPRFTESKVWAKDWNLDPTSGVERELTTQYTISDNQPFTIDSTQHTGRLIEAKTLTDTFAQDGIVEKVYSHSSNWDESLPLLSETWATEQGVLVKKRWVSSLYEQDDENLSYILNPRVIETKIQDSANTKRATIGYLYQPNSTVSIYGLVSDVIEYDFPATSNQKRRTHTEYNLATVYTDRRILGLVSEKTVYDNVNSLVSKVTFNYDEGDFTGNGQNISPIQHDNTTYGASFITGRGLLTSTTRWAVPSQTDPITSIIKYNTAGLPISAKDAMNSEVKTDYTDSFDNITGTNTFAYPTSVTDAANNTSYSKYDFYTGAIKRAETPAPQGQTTGAIKTWSYDSYGKIERTTVGANGNNTDPYTRYVYPTTGNVVESYTTVTDYNNNNQADAADEVGSAVFTDGFGRTIKSRSDLPNAPVGQYAASKVEYDQLGRVKRQSNVAEVNSSWQVVGDDAANGWLWMSYEYDWKGRVIKTTKPDSTFTETIYEGCGCAGGEIVTLKGEEVEPGKRRTQKIYKDILGRTYKTQVLNWDNSVYSITKTEFDALDRVTKVVQYKENELENNSCTIQQQTDKLCQVSTMEYDGHGRLFKQHSPEQYTVSNGAINQLTYTTFTYNPDDTTYSVTDGRGASATYTYNSRKQITQVTYGAPSGSGITVPQPTSFTYDVVGNRTAMYYDNGSTTYNYDALSRITSETKNFNGVSNSYAINYTYDIIGNLKSIADPFNTTVNYNYDKIGRLNGITGSGYVGSSTLASNFQYRAWGAVKGMTYGNNAQLAMTYNSRLQPTRYEVSNLEPWITPNITTRGSNYEYYADGQLKFADSLADNKFDRAFKYDYMNRVTETSTGAEANGGTTADGPYKQTYEYDVWGNVTTRGRRLWTQPFGTENIPVTNNRRSYWGYNADGKPLGSYDGSHTYDATGKQTLFVAGQGWVGGGQTGNENQPGLEIAQGFDGDGAPNKRVTTSRTEEYVGGGPQTTITTTVGTTYYLHSTVLGGQVIAEMKLNTQTGQINKESGYFYLEKMLLAKQTTAYSINQISWQHTDPMTGSSFTTEEGRYVVENKEIDPLGTDVTEPPQSGVLLEPSWFDPHKDFFWPIAYEGGQTGEAERGMAEYASRVNAEYDRRRAEYFWSTGRRDIAMEIVANNPNVGLDVRSFRLGETVTFSIFGSNAASYLFGLSNRIESGDLRAATSGEAAAHLREMRGGQAEEAAYVDVMSSPQLGSAGSGVQRRQRVRLSGQRLADYKKERNRLLAMLRNKNSACAIFLMQTFNLSGSRIANTVLGQRVFDGTLSTLSLGDAGLDRQRGVLNSHYASVQAFFNANASTTRAATAFYATPDDRGATPRDVYYAPIGLRASTILHESLHIFFGSRFPDDTSLANHLGTTIQSSTFAIDDALERGGCK